MIIASTSPQIAERIVIDETQTRLFEAAVRAAWALRDPVAPGKPTAAERAAEVYRIARTVVNQPYVSDFTVPTKLTADSLREEIRKEADRRTADRTMRIVAAEIAETAGGQSLGLLRDDVPAGLTRMNDAFQTAAAEFIAASAKAPVSLSGREDADTIAAFAARTDIAYRLDNILQRRLAVGSAFGESTCSAGSLWVFAAVPEHHYEQMTPARGKPFPRVVVDDPDRGVLIAELATDYYNDQRGWASKDPATRWRDLLSVIEPSIAGFQQTEQRTDRWRAVSQAVASVPWMTTMGVRDRAQQLPALYAQQLQRRAQELTAA